MDKQTKSMIDALREWLRQYDDLRNQRLNVDGLPGGIGAFSIIADSIPEKVADFMLARKRKRLFYLAKECPFDSNDAAQNIENLEWYEDFSAWVYRQNGLRNYPQPGGNITCTGVEDTTAGAIVAITEDGRAEYRIAITVEYTERMF